MNAASGPEAAASELLSRAVVVERAYAVELRRQLGTDMAGDPYIWTKAAEAAEEYVAFLEKLIALLDTGGVSALL